MIDRLKLFLLGTQMFSLSKMFSQYPLQAKTDICYTLILYTRLRSGPLEYD